MRVLTLIAWLMIPVLVFAYHFGPGQERLRLDEAARILAEADHFAAEQQWAQAAASYEEALKVLPVERRAESMRIRLEKDKALMLAKQLPAAHEDLKSLVEELGDDKNADPRLLENATSALANSRYYLTWLMRWKDWARRRGNRRSKPPGKNTATWPSKLTASAMQLPPTSTAKISNRRFGWRMDLGELQGLPLPSQ